MWSGAFSHEFQVLAAAGYVVAAANQFGTTAGYGQAHALGNYIGSQERECAEIIAVLDALPHVDPARVGVTGGSCGGFLTNWLIGHTHRFAAAVTQRSISDLVSKFGTGDNGPEQATAECAAPPWLDVQTLWRHSPLAFAPQVRTPTLILHASDDHRTPLAQAEAWFAALRWHGVPVEMIVYEGESHDLTRSGRPENRLHHLSSLLGWFERHLRP
jgi:dipeptidyl aminopeptidase/acylaminoacyl peptidase